MSIELHNTLVNVVTELRQRLADTEQFSNMDLTINVSGRVANGNMKVEYRLGESSYSNIVKGGSLDPVVDEFIRRTGWNDRNAPLMLEAPKTIDNESQTVETVDEILF